jgi:hypothetical protein
MAAAVMIGGAIGRGSLSSVDAYENQPMRAQPM